MKYTGSKSAYSKWNKQLPILLISGSEDPVGDFGKGVARVEEGMCRAIGYKGHYPVIYESAGEDLYLKKCMGCCMIDDGRCNIQQNCEIFYNAPEQMQYTWRLRDKKIN